MSWCNPPFTPENLPRAWLSKALLEWMDGAPSILLVPRSAFEKWRHKACVNPEGKGSI